MTTDFSSPGAKVIKVTSDSPVLLGELRIPNNTLCYVIGEHRGSGGEDFYMVRPFSRDIPAFYILKNRTLRVPNYEVVEPPTNIINFH